MIQVKVAVRRFEYDELKEKIPPDARIVILSCDSCAKLNNGLGGDQGVKNLNDKLV
jgi:hypothetical protein